MRILFLTQYYPPETGAPQNRLWDLSRRLSCAGHEVTVLTALPNYPKGEIFQGYRRRFMMREDRDNVHILRTWIFATKKKNFLPKVINYLTFAILSCVVGLCFVDPVDAVFVESPPLFLGVSGAILAKAKRARFVLNVSDLWPESAVALGILRNQWLIRWTTNLEEGLYRCAHLVTGQTQGIVNSICTRCPESSVALLTNGVAPEYLGAVEAARTKRWKIRQKLSFGEKLVVAYTGVHGFSQGLETIIYAAELLAGHKDIQFAFWGDGPEKPTLQAMAVAKGLHNVQFFPSQDYGRMPEILAAIDVSIVPLRRTDLFKGALPSKLFEAIGAGIPVIAAVEGEAKALVTLSHGGLVVEPENPGEMAKAILRLSCDPLLRQRISTDGQNYIAAHYNRKVIAERFERLLTAIVVNGHIGAEGRTPTQGADDSETSSLQLVGKKHPKTAG